MSIRSTDDATAVALKLMARVAVDKASAEIDLMPAHCAEVALACVNEAQPLYADINARIIDVAALGRDPLETVGSANDVVIYLNDAIRHEHARQIDAALAATQDAALVLMSQMLRLKSLRALIGGGK
ncbi:MAG: hypothetical protein QM754_00570 [Tepidisphaeraceae bacterium]